MATPYVAAIEQAEDANTCDEDLDSIEGVKCSDREERPQERSTRPA
jgi:hypothetical protein